MEQAQKTEKLVVRISTMEKPLGSCPTMQINASNPTTLIGALSAAQELYEGLFMVISESITVRIHRPIISGGIFLRSTLNITDFMGLTDAHRRRV